MSMLRFPVIKLRSSCLQCNDFFESGSESLLTDL